MKTYFLAATAALIATISVANAQLADKRSFMHPLGFWSNNYYVAQREVYPRLIYAQPDPYVDWSSEGGWVLHERNW
jgi:hypothetical protein